MKLYALVTAAVIGASPAFAQEVGDEVMELLKEAHRMMGLAEKLLHEESVERAERNEKDAAERLAEVIKKARSAGGQDPRKPQQDQDPAKSKPRRPGDSAKRVCDPHRADPPSVFKSRGDSGSWGNLPPSVRAILFEAAKDEIPPEFLEVWRKYGKLIEESAK